MKTSKSFNQEYIEKAKTLIHEILEDKKEYDDWTQICSPDILKNWPLATEQEYRSLLEELNTIGYENIKIIQSRIH